MERNKESLSNIIATAKKPFGRGWLFVPELKLMKFPRLFNGALSREVSRSSSIVSIPGIIKAIYVTRGSKSCRNLIPQPYGIRGMLIEVATFMLSLNQWNYPCLLYFSPSLTAIVSFTSETFSVFQNIISSKMRIFGIWKIVNYTLLLIFSFS